MNATDSRSLDGTISVNGTLSGSISAGRTLSGSLSHNNTLSGVLTVPHDANSSRDYTVLDNKPSIEDVELLGNKTFEELGLEPLDNEDLMDILVL